MLNKTFWLIDWPKPKIYVAQSAFGVTVMCYTSLHSVNWVSIQMIGRQRCSLPTRCYFMHGHIQSCYSIVASGLDEKGGKLKTSGGERKKMRYQEWRQGSVVLGVNLWAWNSVYVVSGKNIARNLRAHSSQMLSHSALLTCHNPTRPHA
jgi:hypothetical protein